MSRFYYALAWTVFFARLVWQTLVITGLVSRDIGPQTDLGVYACFLMLLAIYERVVARRSGGA